MGITITDEARRCLVAFEDQTGATARDCVVDEGRDRVLVLVEPGGMGAAIGHDGQHVEALERRLGRDVKLIEYADTPEAFVASALAPAVVHNVTVSEGDTTVAYAEVEPADRGVAIGANGANIDAARTFARRHFGVDEIELA